MIINKAALAGIFTNLKTTFNKAMSEVTPTWNKIAMLVESTTTQNDYAWLGEWPSMRKWIGDKVVKALAAHGYSIRNDDYEATIGVDRNNIEDDNIGIYAPMTAEAGQSAARWPDQLVYALVNGGFTTPCYDGQNFIDTDHPVVNPATGQAESVSNKGVVALSAASYAAAKASFGAARLAMQTFKNDSGETLQIKPNILLVPPALEETANLLMKSDFPGQEPNPYKGACEVVVSSRLTSDTAWFLLDTTRPVKPYIFQRRKAPVFVDQTDPNADDVFTRKTYKYGTEARGAGGYGFWQLAYGSTGLGA